MPVTPVGAVGAVALYDIDPDTVAARVLACPAVAGLSAGPFGAAATYLPGRKVTGVRISPNTVEVHVVARYGPTVTELAGQVRSALSGRVLGRTVDIVVEDLVVVDSASDNPRAVELATTVVVDPVLGTVVPASAPAAVVEIPVVVEVVDPAGVLDVIDEPAAASPPEQSAGSRASRWGRAGRSG